MKKIEVIKILEWHNSGTLKTDEAVDKIFSLFSVSGSDLEKADMWYCLHKNHVNKLFNSTKTEYPPTELEDIKNPNLWKAEHWRWFLNNYR